MRKTKKQRNGGLRESVCGSAEADQLSAESRNEGRSATLEPRECAICKNGFKTLPKSKQYYCSQFCMIRSGKYTRRFWDDCNFSLFSEISSMYSNTED